MEKTELITNTSETISNKGNEVIVFSDRGGIITSVKIKCVEILYQDMYQETLLDYSKSVKWGIPYMFPNAWPLTPEEREKSWINLPQHWFWRINKWEKVQSNNIDEYIQELNFTESESFAFQWKVTNTIKILENWIEIIHEIENKGTENMPISTWLHPYFRIPEWKKEDIKFNLDWGEKVKNSIDIWWNDGTISFDNPWIPFDVDIPWLWILTIEVSSEYKKFWVRSLPWKDFVCIEPVMSDEWGIVNNPIIVNPGEINSNFMKISVNVNL